MSGPVQEFSHCVVSLSVHPYNSTVGQEWVVDDGMMVYSTQAPATGKQTLPSSSEQWPLSVWQPPAGQYILPHDHSDLPVTDVLEEREWR